MPTYPIVKIPPEIQAALNAIPQTPQAPKEPVAPILQVPEEPESASAIRFFFGLGICLLSGLAFEKKSGTMLGLFLLFIGVTIIIFYFKSWSCVR
ncbi:hypothetical protein [Hymenobacter aerophilus]|uniref:hypothetical protein n=1 Tax=Hymenobacter aerophilus TaxID=119644 RepID=UPI00196A11BB|nr:hypothetical protein [Hymenobacter aerophilus]